MAAKNHRQWMADPILQPNEWVDSRIYSDPQIFEEELAKIFRKTWIPVCHESELPNAYGIIAPVRTIVLSRRTDFVASSGRRLSPLSASAAAGTAMR